jgi:uncharacterized protein (DUF3820 family)
LTFKQKILPVLKRYSSLEWGACALFLITACLFVFAHAWYQDLDHDEHQFVVPAALFSRSGQLPYRDFPLFHQPYLIFVYGAANLFCSSPFAAARTLCAVGASLTMLLLVAAGLCRSSNRKAWTLCLPVLLLLTSPLFLWTSGRTWNHDLPTLLALASVILVVGVRSDSFKWQRWLIAGFAAALAVGGRLTFAPTCLALACAPLIWPGFPLRERFRLAAVCGFGVFLGLLPSLLFYLWQPEAYLFGNFGYPRLQNIVAENGMIPKPMQLSRRIQSAYQKIVVLNLPLGIAFVVIALPGSWLLWWKKRDFAGVLILLLTLSLLPGAFAPAHVRVQYFYSPAVFAVLAIIWGMQAFGRWPSWVLAGLCAAGLLQYGTKDSTLNDVLRDRPTAISKVSAEATRLKKKVPSGKVLTLAPISAIEAGLEIYPAFAVGPFGWRSAEFLEEGQRQRLGIIGPPNVESALENDMPAAIITGNEKPIVEEDLVKFAREHNYRSEPFTKKRLLWLPPQNDESTR